MQQKYHIHLLDNYAQDAYGNELLKYKENFKIYQNMLIDLENLKNASNATQDKIEFLKFQVNEIDSANIQSVNEDEELKNELEILENVEKLKELTGTSYWTINGDDNSIIDAMNKIKQNLSKACTYDTKLEEIESQFNEISENLREIGTQLRNYNSNLQNDEERLNEIQERLYILDKLKHKYGGTLDAVLSTFEKLSQELNNIEFSNQNIETLELKIKDIKNQLITNAQNISNKRKNYAEVLSSLIQDKLECLELPKSRFKIDITPKELSNDGIDNVEFLISTNISEDLKPLAKVASGGEISRVMLAIKSIFAQSDDIDTVIFDEIDTGISGKTSQSVADEILELSKYHQVILITHQPIIASKADKHFYVRKSQNDITQVEVYVLTGENKIKAIAELAGGEINEQSIEFAKSLCSHI